MLAPKLKQTSSGQLLFGAAVSVVTVADAAAIVGNDGRENSNNNNMLIQLIDFACCDLGPCQASQFGPECKHSLSTLMAR